MAEKKAKAAGGSWTTAGTWEPEGVPTNADDVVLAVGSGNVTIAAASTCRSLDASAYAGTLKHEAFNLTISGSTAAPSNKVLVFGAGMTYTTTSPTTSKIVLANTVASTVHLLDFGGKTTGPVEITSAPPATSTYQWVGEHKAAATSTVSVGRGGLDTNGQTCNWGLFAASGSGTRELKFGASQITITGTGTAWNVEETTNLTIAVNTATVTMSGAAAVFKGAKNWNGLTLKMTGSGIAALSVTGGTLAAFERVGTATKTDALEVASGEMTVTGKVTLTGNSLTNRLLVSSTALGSPATISAASESLANVDFTDVKGKGAAKWEGTSIGNGLGNEGIVFTEAVTRFAKAAGLWSSTATWAATSGGAAGASVPLCHDTVKMDATAGAGEYKQDMPRSCADLDCTGFTRTLTATINTSIYGSRTFSSGMTHTAGNAHLYRGRGSHTLTSAEKTSPSTSVLAPGGTYTLTDNFNAVLANITMQAGTFYSPVAEVVCGAMASSGIVARKYKMGNALWKLGAALTVVSFSTPTGLTVEAEGSTIEITDTSLNQKLFNGGAFSYNKIKVPASTLGSVKFVFNNSIDTLEIAGPKAVVFQAGDTQTVNSFTFTTGSEAVITITSSSTTEPAILKKTSGLVSLDWLSLKNSKAEGGALFYAGANSINVSGNSGWKFEAAPTEFPTQVVLNASATGSSGSVNLTAPTGLSVGASQAVSMAVAAVTAPTRVLLGASPSTAAALLALTANTRVQTAVATASSSGSLGLTAATRVLLAAAAGQPSVTLALAAPARLVLGPSTIVAGTALVLSTGIVVLAPYTPLPTGGYPDDTGTGGFPVLQTPTSGRPAESRVGGYPFLVVRTGGYPDGGATFGFPVEVLTLGDPVERSRSGAPNEGDRTGRPRESRTWGRGDSET